MRPLNQYSYVAYDAYNYIIEKRMEPADAWDLAAEAIIKSESGRKKGCPRVTFIGLCNGGHLKNLSKADDINSKNYEYARYSIEVWKANPDMSRDDMWKKVQEKFNTTASHQGQLDVALGVREYWV